MAGSELEIDERLLLGVHDVDAQNQQVVDGVAHASAADVRPSGQLESVLAGPLAPFDRQQDRHPDGGMDAGRLVAAAERHAVENRR